MPEITSVENIRAKLREFDERVDGAVIAAKTLSRIKIDAEKLLNDIQSTASKSEQSLQNMEKVRAQIETVQSDWNKLKVHIDNGQKESKEVRELLMSELDAAIQSIGSKVKEAGATLIATNKSALSEQAELLKRLDANTQKNAEAVASATNLVTQKAESLGKLVVTLREELQGETRTKLLHAEELLETQFNEIDRQVQESLTSTKENLRRSAESNEKLIREEMDGFKKEMKASLAEHQQILDRQLTDFLNKQNALVQNLNQQIDSYDRVSQAQASELSSAHSKIQELGSSVNSHKTTTTDELARLSKILSKLSDVTSEIHTKMASHDQTNIAVNSAIQATSLRLDKTVEKLKQLPLLGSKFKE